MSDLQNAITDRLKTVIDPETGADVVRMRLVENLSVAAEELTQLINSST